MTPANTCSNCKGSNLYQSKEVHSGGGYAPNYLPGMTNNWGYPVGKFRVVVCVDCGLAQFYAADGATSRIPTAKGWSKLECPFVTVGTIGSN